MIQTRRLEMTVSLSVLEHLGMNLYSSVPPVISEIVANAWDADATTTNVQIDTDTQTISILDDGVGMTRDEVIDQFLTVGFQRRVELTTVTEIHDRSPMGRKGIGKLSSFSIADVVTVYTKKDGKTTTFQLDMKKIKSQFDSDEEKSIPIEELKESHAAISERGTVVVLSAIRKRIDTNTEKWMRQRLARRFSVIGPQFNFDLKVNGVSISPQDRGYLKDIEYLWVYGDQADIIEACGNLAGDREADLRTQAMRLAAPDLTISGWIGTVKSPNSLKADDNENLNSIAIFMRGKIAHEDVLTDIGIKEIYANYLVGEIHCDGFDTDGSDDMATSNRQVLKRDDPRFEELRDTLRKELRHISDCWSQWRGDDGVKLFVDQIPAVEAWLQNLNDRTQKRAARWIGRLNTIRAEHDHDRLELLKASILAFESYRRKLELDELDDIDDQNTEQILHAFKDIDSLELSYYGQIVKLRLGVIQTLQKKIHDNEKENAVRAVIYDHLWLLDPSWERVRGTEASESTISNFLKQNTASLSDKERRARVDIAYRTAGGKHVIIELKRASVKVNIDDLIKQIRKYRGGVQKILQTMTNRDWPLEIICLLGKPPQEWSSLPNGRQDVINSLSTVDARIVFYEELLGNARNAYREYLDEHTNLDPLWKIFAGIDDFANLPSRNEENLTNSN